ncbi:MAG: hypothetical protein AAFO79_04590, partial [Pseudomonadota bacterium]
MSETAAKSGLEPTGDGHARDSDRTDPAAHQPPPRRRAAGPARRNIAANDDGPSIGGLIYALNQRPSRRPFLLAGIASAVWVVLALGIGFAYLGAEQRAGTGILGALTSPEGLIFLFARAVPVALFWSAATLVWLAQELRLVSSAMTEVAIRLAEPDRLAEQSVISLGQTVRRQVGSMNDAISRALGRAGELEAIVHNEVTAL